MPESREPIRKIQPDDVPFAPDLTNAELDLLMGHPVFERLVPSFRSSGRFRQILKMHARIVACDEGDIIIRQGDWGNSAFIILSGQVAIDLEPVGEFLSKEELGRGSIQKKSLFQSLAQLWRNHRQPEFRSSTGGDPKSVSSREDGTHFFFQDVPRLLHDFKTIQLAAGELFGELAALGRTARSATVFAIADNSQLLEMRWQGLRDLMRGDAGFREMIDDRFRRTALVEFLCHAPQLRHLADEKTATEELRVHAQLATYGEYDRPGSFMQLAGEGAADNLAREELIAEEGTYPNGVILIRSGVARVSRKHHNGHQTVSYLTPGSIFGFEELRAGWETGKAVPFRYSLRAIGYLTAVIIPTALAEKHLLECVRAGANAAKNSHPPTTAPRPVSEVGFVNLETVEFLVQERFVNGTATMLIDLDRCTRCDDCVRACASAHDNNPRFLRQGPVHTNVMVARACMHCQDPTCMIECPTGAISRQLDEGEVTINDSTCIGCGACERNCPYDAIRMVEIRDSEGMFIRAGKDRRTISKATKCDLCVDQLGGPACQRACPHDALVRIDMSDTERLAAWLDR